ncbi:SapC family protein [uncultured Thiodictyon sp.]|jgi:hypothetical protein|uniref:SapC family protein n=1 Tax=uncultured Thiodictyon sp. TaxID=1846217 RepID=UPI0025EA17DE|nr:SapC family protein [uncultured Thiodictyon sp.]
MATQLMFYASAVPLSSQRHIGLSVKVGGDFGFARKANSVPLTAVEIPRAAADYVVVFAGQGDGIMPVVILGIEPEHNLFIKENGAWDGVYVPAFVRRYPFVFAGSADAKTFTLCIDESFSGCNRDGRGEQLFDTDGERTQYLDTVLNFVKDYQVQHQRTSALCKHLSDLGLLEPMQAQFTLPGGARRGLTGFMAVNRTKLKALDRETLTNLVVSDELELIYLHLQSLQNFNRMLQRIGAEPSTVPAAEGDEPAAHEEGDGAPVTH